MEVRDTQRQLADARKAMLKAVNDYSRVKSELDRSKEAISAAADARAEAERNLAAKQGEADTALAKLEATKKELQAAEEKLRSDVLERYDASVIRLTFALNEKRLLLDQKGGGVFYLPLVNIAGKTVMPGFHKQLFGDAEYALNFDRVDRLEYRVNVTSAPLEEAGTQLRGPLLLFPGEPRLAAIEFNVRGRKPLAALTIDALKQRGLDDLFLLSRVRSARSPRRSATAARSISVPAVRSSIFATPGAVPAANCAPSRGISSSRSRAISSASSPESRISTWAAGRRRNATCFRRTSSGTGRKPPAGKSGECRYFEDFSKGVREIRAGQNE